MNVNADTHRCDAKGCARTESRAGISPVGNTLDLCQHNSLDKIVSLEVNDEAKEPTQSCHI